MLGCNRGDEKRREESEGSERKRKSIPITCSEGVRELREEISKKKENNILKLDICFYLNNPIKFGMIVFVMDKIEILNVLHIGPPKSCTRFTWFFPYFCPL